VHLDNCKIIGLEDEYFNYLKNGIERKKGFRDLILMVSDCNYEKVQENIKGLLEGNIPMSVQYLNPKLLNDDILYTPVDF
jgi:hypothetical protein